MSLVNLKKIKAPEIEVPCVSNMTNEELLDYIISSFNEYYDKSDISNRAKYSSCRDFYQGVARGFWQCERIVNELKGRLNAEKNN